MQGVALNRLSFFCLIFLASPVVCLHAEVLLGIDVLREANFAPLRGKRIGLITNQSGVDSHGQATRVILQRAPGVRLVRLFAPEHGIDGNIKAGLDVPTQKDRLTGLKVYSLYGETRKPTPAMLRDLDALVFDVQDIGCRSYTFVSTMVSAMDACGEAGIPFYVLDRPNPLGGLRVEGPLVRPGWKSFVGFIPVPYVHGMTVGEIAQMANERGFISHPCELHVIPLKGWNRSMTWKDTALRWIPTSPNIPREDTPVYYVVTGFIGSLAGMELGTGTPEAFRLIATKGLDGYRLASEINALHLDGVLAVPRIINGLYGVELQIDPKTPANLTALGVFITSRVNQLATPSPYSRSSFSQRNLFFKVYGSPLIHTELAHYKSPQSIAQRWNAELSSFLSLRKNYLLYPYPQPEKEKIIIKKAKKVKILTDQSMD
ncbi:DUF1343 domain-containing protein [Candidatus Methylacidiphilum infernorum]|uniref:DUF1343 domain-containing protein n=1 Tax=Candidatus Methylacidiphilum infernorum TaxID=511746 RepID=A0ABX7PUB3_9BACT|nr:DUF1343 domain-containing protein [Candidatus Methylacidiphilum infernorum]QSR86584.1 DUF1343 domain-containing protein [Candidatus Methylacidiphilum infernorum]